MSGDNKNSKQLYFIAILPDDEILKQVTAIKKDFANRFQSKAALKSPPHITLIPPFHFEVEQQKKLSQTLDQFCHGRKGFPLRLQDFKAFAPRVIYVQVAKCEELNQLYFDINTHFEKELMLVSKRRKGRKFAPHMTVAFSDLSKDMFFKAWKEYRHKPYNNSFTCNSCTLLAHNGRTWDVLHQANFLDLNEEK